MQASCRLPTSKYVSLLICLLLFSVVSTAQVPQWAIKLGSAGSDEGFYCKVAPNGNIVVGGKFSDTMDLDPSAATYNIISNGSEDMFLACYTAAGGFLWGFGLGGTNVDAIRYITFDASSNVIVDGDFRGQNVDFDPSPAVHALSDNGTQHTWDPPDGGDGFVAKYSSTGVYQWAFNLGGLYVYDHGKALATDESNNIYVSAYYTDVMDIDPSAGVVNKSSITDGKIFLGKYSPAGQLIWGEAFGSKGGAGVDAVAQEMVYSKGYLYLAGSFQDSADFDPSPSTTSLTSTGKYDGFVAKYDTAGHFVFVRQEIGSGTNDIMNGITLDSLDNIYTIGFTDAAIVSLPPSAVTFNPTPGGGGNFDIILTKYDKNGTLQWAHAIGSTDKDMGYAIVTMHNKLYCTGTFQGTVDFDPSPAVASLTSSGNNGDIFLATYDLGGNYLCAFNIGGNNVYDEGSSVCKDGQNNIYVAGQFDGANVDFDPAATSLQLSSSGTGDGFLVKYPGTCGGGGESVKGTSAVIDIDLYPNPAYNEAYLVCDVAKYPGATAGIYDITGRLVLRIALSNVKTAIPVSMLQPGLYQCKIDLQGQGTISKKLVIVN